MFYKRLIDVTINHSPLSLEAQLASRRTLNLLELRKEISEDLILGIKKNTLHYSRHLANH